jgi:hypothetical protein
MKEGPLRRKCKGAFDAADMSEVKRWLAPGKDGDDEDARKRRDALDWAWDTTLPPQPRRAADTESALQTPISDAGTMPFTASTAPFESSWMSPGTTRKGDETGGSGMTGVTVSTLLL